MQDEDDADVHAAVVAHDVPAVPSTEQADADLARRLALGLQPDRWLNFSIFQPVVCIWQRR